MFYLDGDITVFNFLKDSPLTYISKQQGVRYVLSIRQNILLVRIVALECSILNSTKLEMLSNTGWLPKGLKRLSTPVSSLSFLYHSLTVVVREWALILKLENWIVVKILNEFYTQIHSLCYARIFYNRQQKNAIVCLHFHFMRERIFWHRQLSRTE